MAQKLGIRNDTTSHLQINFTFCRVITVLCKLCTEKYAKYTNTTNVTLEFGDRPRNELRHARFSSWPQDVCLPILFSLTWSVDTVMVGTIIMIITTFPPPTYLRDNS